MWKILYKIVKFLLFMICIAPIVAVIILANIAFVILDEEVNQFTKYD